MIIDHIGFAVTDFTRSRAFYVTALAPLGIVVMKEGEDWAMLGRDGKSEFWFGVSKHKAPVKPGPVHIAFLAANRRQVREFHAAAMALGVKDNGAPGIRAHYHANYFGAFVIDPNGHNIEAVCHAAET
jgi:catechol 2,3-dioxygenase-like lactoylglutathione lyase family enzyme